jgi:hypothetical protein
MQNKRKPQSERLKGRRISAAAGPSEAIVRLCVGARAPINIRKFAGWEGRFTPAQDSQPLILETVTQSK